MASAGSTNIWRERSDYIYAFYLVAAAAALAALAEFKLPKAAVPLALLTLILGATGIGIGSHVATAGGRVRHREFRYVLPPEPREHSKHEH